MAPLIDMLDRLNRKERFFLVEAALGVPGFRLSEDFRHRIKSAIGVEIPADPAPGTYFCGMDYHLDWLYAAFVLAENPDAGCYASPNFPSANGVLNVNANQEDIDLVVAIAGDEHVDVVLIEAKGVMNWGPDQLRSKARRLGVIFGPVGKRHDKVTPHFLLASPHDRPELASVVFAKWDSPAPAPRWMCRDGKFPWVELDNVRKAQRVRIERCFDPTGAASAKGTSWRVRAK